MNIAGVLVHAKPGDCEQVATSLSQLAGVEIHATTKDSRFVITIEEQEGGLLSQTLTELNNIQGVLSAAMVYQHSEEEQ